MNTQAGNSGWRPAESIGGKIKLSFRLYFICLVLCSSFFVLVLVIFIGFVYEFVYKVL
jgi:hypothetical protein